MKNNFFTFLNFVYKFFTQNIYNIKFLPIFIFLLKQNFLFCQPFSVSNYINSEYLQKNFYAIYNPYKIFYTPAQYQQLPTSVILTNFPNPFSELTYIYIRLPEQPQPHNIILRIYDLFGSVVKEYKLPDKDKHLIIWDGTDETSRKVSSGGYLCVVYYNGGKIIRKIGFVK